MIGWLVLIRLVLIVLSYKKMDYNEKVKILIGLEFIRTLMVPGIGLPEYIT